MLRRYFSETMEFMEEYGVEAVDLNDGFMLLWKFCDFFVYHFHDFYNIFFLDVIY